LASAISSADSQLTVLDDRVDAEDRAEYLWLKAHVLRGYGNHRVVMGTEALTDGWNARRKKFSEASSAQAYLGHFMHTQSAMYSIQLLAHSLNFAHSGPFQAKEAIGVVAGALVSGGAWLIELPKTPPSSQYVSKTSPGVFPPLNMRFGTKVDFLFIASQEGNQWLRGYVPMKGTIVAGRSGMTVATGFDVGQWTVAQLNKFAFPADLMTQIKCFAAPHNFKGLTRKQVAAAVAKLGPVPVLDKDQADLCDGAVFGAILNNAIRGWNQAKGVKLPVFTQLPAGWQTVWFSRNYQEGGSPKNADAIAFRREATAGNWLEAIKKLRAYTDYKKRANQEADLLVKELPAAIAAGAPAPQ